MRGSSVLPAIGGGGGAEWFRLEHRQSKYKFLRAGVTEQRLGRTSADASAETGTSSAASFSVEGERRTTSC